MRAPAIIFATIITALQPAGADQVDVVVQAGHQGRPQSCVADAAADALRRDGFSVRRRPADYRAHDTARAAVFLHFDGSAPACRSGASVGFPATTNPAFIQAWENRYRPIFPFRFAGENITKNEAQYYGFRKVDAPGRALLIEFGEMTCPVQERWMAPRLHALGRDVARFISAELRP
jgi:hypothetical protein